MVQFSILFCIVDAYTDKTHPKQQYAGDNDAFKRSSYYNVKTFDMFFLKSFSNASLIQSDIVRIFKIIYLFPFLLYIVKTKNKASHSWIFFAE